MDSKNESQEITEIDVEGLMRLIPHRYPFLLIDRLTNIVPGESATGIKNVTINEPFFQGHFPGHPVMPGVLIIESMAQTAGALVMHTIGLGSEGRVVYFMSIDSARFRKPVVPGDTMVINAVKQRSRGNIWKFSAKAMVGETLVAESVFSAMIVDN